jgi:hypothetical protein
VYYQNGYLLLRNYDTKQLELYDTNLTLLKTLNIPNANNISFINLFEIDDFLVISYVDVVSSDFKMYGLLKTLSYETISQGNGYVTQNAEGVYFYTEDNIPYFFDTTSLIKGEEYLSEGFKMIQYEDYYILITQNELIIVDLEFEVIDTFDIYGYIDSTVETLLVSDSDGTIYVLQLNDIIK